MFGLSRTQTVRDRERLLNEQYVESERLKQGQELYRNLYNSMASHHASKFRVASLPLDPQVLTARMRAIEPSVRVEWDGKQLIIYTGVPVTEAVANALIAQLPAVDKT